MKSLTYKCVMLVLLAGLAAAEKTKTVTLTAELDRPVLMADEKQTVYLRVGLRGCPVEVMKDRAPVNVAIVIDKSGSMNSNGKIQAAREAAILALYRLKSEDIVSVILYDSDVKVLIPATKMTNRSDIIRHIRSIQAGGSTALYAGVQTGANEVRKFLSNQRVNRIVLLSDGLANVGPDSPSALGKLGADLIDEGVSVTTIGVGNGYNEDLMSQLAFRSDGGHYFCEEPDELAGIFDQEFGRAMSVVAQKVIIEITCPKGIRPIRLLGREGVIKDQTITLDMNHIYGDHEKYVLLQVEAPALDDITNRFNIANVNINYMDIINNNNAKLDTAVAASLTRSRETYNNMQNKHVYADVVEQIAIETNEKALALRDAGQVQQARQMLIGNSAFLHSNAAALGSDKLESYAYENGNDADNLDESKWIYTRKGMRENQTTRRSQR